MPSYHLLLLMYNFLCFNSLSHFFLAYVHNWLLKSLVVFPLFIFLLADSKGVELAKIGPHEFLQLTCLYLQRQPNEAATDIVVGFVSSIMVGVHRQDAKKASKPAAMDVDSEDEAVDDELLDSLAADAAPVSEHDVERRDVEGRTNVFSKPSHVSKVRDLQCAYRYVY
jgi:hypothetical protein